MDAGEVDANELFRIVPTDQNVVLMVPPQDLSWHWIAWRPVRKSQEMAYARGVLADALLNTQNTHVALGPLNAEKTGRWAAVADLQTINNQVLWLQSQQIRIGRIAPWWPAPRPDDTRPTWMADSWQDQVLWQAWGHRKALNLHVDSGSLRNAKLLMDAWRANDVAAGWCGPALAQIFGNEMAGEESRYPMRVRNEAETLMAAMQSPWNLAQGALAAAPQQWHQRLKLKTLQWLESPASTKTAITALCLLIINALGLEWVHHKTQPQQTFWKTQQIQVALEALPTNTVVVDPLRQLQRAIASHPQPNSATSTSRDPLLKALDAIAQSQSSPAVPLINLQYEVNQQLRLVWNAPNPEALSKAKKLLANSTWQLDGSESEWIATAKR